MKEIQIRQAVIEDLFGDEELLKRASLRQPVLYQLPGHPKTIEEWKQLQEKEG